MYLEVQVEIHSEHAKDMFQVQICTEIDEKIH